MKQSFAEFFWEIAGNIQDWRCLGLEIILNTSIQAQLKVPSWALCFCLAALRQIRY
jgi:hypothetical protein